jgi:hypothetical protein
VGGIDILDWTGVGAAVDSVTDDSLVVVVEVDSPVAQDDSAMAQAGITGIRRIRFFIISLNLTNWIRRKWHRRMD